MVKLQAPLKKSWTVHQLCLIVLFNASGKKLTEERLFVNTPSTTINSRVWKLLTCAQVCLMNRWPDNEIKFQDNRSIKAQQHQIKVYNSKKWPAQLQTIFPKSLILSQTNLSECRLLEKSWHACNQKQLPST